MYNTINDDTLMQELYNETRHSMIADFDPVRNALFTSTAKRSCVRRILRPRDVSQRQAKLIAEAVHLCVASR